MESEFTYKSFLAFTAHITQDLEAKPSPVKKAWERAHNTVTSQPSPHLSKVWEREHMTQWPHGQALTCQRCEREHTWHSDLKAKPSPVKKVWESTHDTVTMTMQPNPHLSKVWERAHVTQQPCGRALTCQRCEREHTWRKSFSPVSSGAGWQPPTAAASLSPDASSPATASHWNTMTQVITTHQVTDHWNSSGRSQNRSD